MFGSKTKNYCLIGLVYLGFMVFSIATDYGENHSRPRCPLLSANQEKNEYQF